VGWVTTLVYRYLTAHMSSTAASDFTWGHQWSAVIARSLLGQADLFAYGMFVAVLVVVLQQRGVVSVGRWVLPALLGAAAVLAWAGLAGPMEPFARRFVGMAAALVLLAVTLPRKAGEPNGVARGLEVRPLRYVGLVSYSVYLWHVPVLFWLSAHGLAFGRDPAGLLGNVVLVAVVTLALSSLTYRYVERPALAAKKRMDPRPSMTPKPVGATPQS
jgi:peptidoglycan/LPS O-acetylase OafA/YrhL